jgi:predicted GNAT family N-acyltransferase
MVSIDFDKVWFKKLEMTDDLAAFHCSEEDDSGCDDFIRNINEAKQYQKERHGITYLFFYEETMVGYATLAMSSISAERLEQGEEEVRLRFYPCLLIGRLAVHNGWRHKDVGTYIAEWATGLALELSSQIGCRYVVLEAKESKIGFYSNIGFQKGATLTGDRLVWLYKKIASDE